MQNLCETYRESTNLASELCTNGRRPVFFDIETTGLSPKGSVIYLIGCYYPLLAHGMPNGIWQMKQWFSESPDEESAIIRQFLEFLTPDMLLCHYNGSNFDLPFLAARMELYGLTGLPSFGDTLDWYRLLAPLKDRFPLQGRRQKHMEALISMEREDLYDGGALIPLYSEYVGKVRFDPVRAKEILKLLLCHNREDVLGLARISSLGAVLGLINGEFGCTGIEKQSDTVVFSLSPDRPLPCKINWSLRLPTPSKTVTVEISGCDSRVRITVPMISGTLYYYYDNYRDYYYLPKEDLCIYHSLAKSVPARHRVRCTKDTARKKVTGTFLPQPENIFSPAFSFDRKDSVLFFSPEHLTENSPQVLQYLRSILKRSSYPKDFL